MLPAADSKEQLLFLERAVPACVRSLVDASQQALERYDRHAELCPTDLPRLCVYAEMTG